MNYNLIWKIWNFYDLRGGRKKIRHLFTDPKIIDNMKIFLLFACFLALALAGPTCPYFDIYPTSCQAIGYMANGNATCQAVNPQSYCKKRHDFNIGNCVSYTRQCPDGTECIKEGSVYNCRIAKNNACTYTSNCVPGHTCSLVGSVKKCTCPATADWATLPCMTVNTPYPPGIYNCTALGRTCIANNPQFPIYGYCVSNDGQVCDSDNDCLSGSKCHACKCTPPSQMPRCQNWNIAMDKLSSFEGCVRDKIDPAATPGTAPICDITIWGQAMECCTYGANVCSINLIGIDYGNPNTVAEQIVISMSSTAPSGRDCTLRGHAYDKCSMNLY
jgi:hypothetical protein